MPTDELTVAIAQIAPVWLDRSATLDKVVDTVENAAKQGAKLVAFGEALVPGYPFWVERTDGARFESNLQKDLYAHYVEQAVDIRGGELRPVCETAREHGIAIYLGTIERDPGERGKSLYCTMVYIDASGSIASTHRKLMPTYEERLVWSPGDGHGLRTHTLGAFTLGGLNCWENWLPLARASLYGQGEDLHVAIWPGSRRNTDDITRFIAKESRSYVLSVSGLMRRSDIGAHLPHADLLVESADDWMADGGSCIADPDGNWLVEPIVGEETIVTATLDHRNVRRARQTLDVSGHYARPDVTRLSVNRERQRIVHVKDD